MPFTARCEMEHEWVYHGWLRPELLTWHVNSQYTQHQSSSRCHVSGCHSSLSRRKNEHGSNPRLLNTLLGLGGVERSALLSYIVSLQKRDDTAGRKRWRTWILESIELLPASSFTDYGKFTLYDRISLFVSNCSFLITSSIWQRIRKFTTNTQVKRFIFKYGL